MKAPSVCRSTLLTQVDKAIYRGPDHGSSHEMIFHMRVLVQSCSTVLYCALRYPLQLSVHLAVGNRIKHVC